MVDVLKDLVNAIRNASHQEKKGVQQVLNECSKFTSFLEALEASLARNSSWHDQLLATSKQVELFQSRLEDLAKEKKQTDQDLSTVRFKGAEIKKIEHSLLSREAILTSKKTEFETRVITMKQHVKDLTAQNLALKTKLTQVSQSEQEHAGFRAITVDYDTVRTQLQASRNTQKRQEDALKEMSMQLEESQVKMGQQFEQLNTLRNEKLSLQENLVTMTDQKNQVRSDHEAACWKVQDLRENVRSLENARDLSRRRARMYGADPTVLHETISRLEKESDNLRSHEKTLMTRLTRYKGERDSYKQRLQPGVAALLASDHQQHADIFEADAEHLLGPSSRKRKRTNDNTKIKDTPLSRSKNPQQAADDSMHHVSRESMADIMMREDRHGNDGRGGASYRDGSNERVSADSDIVSEDNNHFTEGLASHNLNGTGRNTNMLNSNAKEQAVQDLDSISNIDQIDLDPGASAAGSNVTTQAQPPVLLPGTFWSIEDILNRSSLSDQIHPRIIYLLRGRIREWNKRRGGWRKTGERRCADMVSRKSKTTWTDGGSDYACNECTRWKRLCCAIFRNKLQLLPVFRETPIPDLGPADEGYWLR